VVIIVGWLYAKTTGSTVVLTSVKCTGFHWGRRSAYSGIEI
jgi:hypothetical protein